MPTSNAVIASREEFMKATDALVPKDLKPAQAIVSGLQIKETASEGDTSDQTTESPPVETVTPGDETVESSATTDEVAASDESDPVAEPGDEKPASEAKKPRSRAQERIEDLVASNKALKATLEYMQGLQRPPAAAEAPKAPAVVESVAPPTLESVGFDTDKWTQAMHAWTTKQIEAGVSNT